MADAIMKFAYARLRFGHLLNSNMLVACNKERNALNGMARASPTTPSFEI